VALVGADGRLDPLGERLRAVSADGRVLVEGATADLWDQVVAEGRPGAVASRPYLLAGGPELGAYRVGPVAQLRVAAPATPLAGELREEWLARAGGAAAARAVQAVADVEAILALAGEVLDADEARDAGDALRAGETASARELGRVGGMANSGGMASVGTTGSSGGAVEPGEAGLAPVRSNHLRLETSRDWADVAEGSVGVGWVDGSRGLLVHRYRVGAGGVVDDALVLTPTAQNEHWLACLLAWALSAEADGPCLEAAVEAAIREADPCLPCVSAPVGHMGVAVEAVVGGEVSNGVRGGADQDH
jgi:NAD-reducing hydrogenase large subunit